MIPIFKDKEGIQGYSNYRKRSRKESWTGTKEKGVNIRKAVWFYITNAIFALRQLMEKYMKGQKELNCVFIDKEKAYDKVPRAEV